MTTTNGSLKAGELRLGNLVRWNPARAHPGTTLMPVLIEISAIWRDKVGFSSPNFDHRVEPFEDDRMQMETRQKPLAELEAVPLEAALLQRAGFRPLEGERFVNDGFELVYDPAQSVFRYRRPDGVCLVVHYLHQLQNLYFSLTNEELDLAP
ncbi:hypothetical protein V9K67_23280 [Paraflavisolibacter sp. H34]|uniref:hypothetical protein n=1 Tax=Huijunlia imazamoxiresistens TaxID=3127457 RepID=UPI003017083E